MKNPSPPKRSPRSPRSSRARSSRRSPAGRRPTMSGSASGSSTRCEPAAGRVAHRVGGLEDVGGDAVEAGEDVPDEDQQRVEDERDDSGQDRQPGDGDEGREQGEARDRVEDAGDRDDRPVDARRRRIDQIASPNEITNPIADRDRGEVEVLDGPCRRGRRGGRRSRPSRSRPPIRPRLAGSSAAGREIGTRSFAVSRIRSAIMSTVTSPEHGAAVGRRRCRPGRRRRGASRARP